MGALELGTRHGQGPSTEEPASSLEKPAAREHARKTRRPRKTPRTCAAHRWSTPQQTVGWIQKQESREHRTTLLLWMSPSITIVLSLVPVDSCVLHGAAAPLLSTPTARREAAPGRPEPVPTGKNNYAQYKPNAIKDICDSA